MQEQEIRAKLKERFNKVKTKIPLEYHELFDFSDIPDEEEKPAREVLLYLVTHGATALNKKKVVKGQMDIPLDESGREDIKNLAKFFQNIPIKKILCSDLSRAKETAEGIAGGAPVISTKDLRSIDYGDLNGKVSSEVTPQLEELMEQWKLDLNYVNYGVESFKSFQERALKVFNEALGESTPSSPIVLVTHRRDCILFMAVVLNNLMPLEGKSLDLFKKIAMDVGAVSTVENQEDPKILQVKIPQLKP